MNPLQTRISAILSLLVLCALPAVGQQQDAGPKAVIFTCRDFSAGSENEDYEQPITASISAAFEVGGYAIVAPETWAGEVQRRAVNPRALLSEEVASSVARAAGADIAVTGYFTVLENSIYISLQCWDVANGVLAAGLQQTARFNIAFYSSLYEKVAEMLPRIHLGPRAGTAGTLDASVRRLPTVSDLTFVSPDEGMEVFLVDNQRLGAIADGKLLWKSEGLVQGSAFNVEKRKSGFHTSRETVRAASEIRLSRMEPERTKALEVDWTLGQLLGLGAALRVYTRPDETFLFLGDYFFVQPPLNSGGSPVLHFDMSVGAGTYLFFPPDFPVRIGVSTGAGSTLSVLTGSASAGYADVYLDVINWWVETRVLGPVIFVRQEWKFALGAGPNLLGTQWMKAGEIPPMTLGVIFRW